MRTRRQAWITTAVLGLLTMAFTANMDTDTYIGYAYANTSDSKTPVYKELLTDEFVNGNRTQTVSQYYDGSNKLIARRTLDFSNATFAPDFKTEDLRTGYVEGAKVTGNQVKLFVKKNWSTPLQEKTIEVPQPLVIDGGFNAFIKSHWSDLQRGAPVSFNFTVCARLDYYKLRATQVAHTDDRMTVRIEPDNSLMRMVATPILIQYDTKTRRMVSYEGKSNIDDENGANLIIKLIYPEKGP